VLSVNLSSQSNQVQNPNTGGVVMENIAPQAQDVLLPGESVVPSEAVQANPTQSNNDQSQDVQP